MNIAKDMVDSLPIIRICDSEYHYTTGYYSNNNWIDEKNIILAKSKDFDNLFGCQLVLVDITSEKELLLVESCNSFIDFLAYEKNLYYISGDTLFCLNVDTMTRREICSCANMSFPHITKDGNYINWMVLENDSPTQCFTIDLRTNVVEKNFEKIFPPPFYDAGHIMICPTDKDKIFFCHEGNAFYITNRLWLFEKDKGLRCIAKQRLDENGDLCDCFGHECWSPNGEGIYFVKYNCSSQAPKGICYTNLDDGETKVLYSKFPYWHVACSPDNNFLASDTQSGSYSGVCLINKQTNEEKMLLKANSNWNHPCHPHPAFSPNSECICYNDLFNGMTSVGIISMKDVI